MTAERVYEELVKGLPAVERLRLVEKIVHDWMAIEGIAPDLLDGEDAQEWVSRTRQESDDHREKQWKPKP